VPTLAPLGAVFAGGARWTTLVGDVRETLRALPDASVQCVVTSPPYWGLRDYGVAGQIGREATPEAYVESLVGVFREVRRVLTRDGTLWLNLGDVYANDGKSGGRTSGKHGRRLGSDAAGVERKKRTTGLPPKSLIGLPWRVAFALQADGWILRSEIIWAKPNPLPEPVLDRPTRAHEHVFLFSKESRYFYNADAIREPMVAGSNGSRFDTGKTRAGSEQIRPVGRGERVDNPNGRNARDVWSIVHEGSGVAHFATMPAEIARRAISAGSRRGDVVLDPFGGSGTTARVALEEGRRAILCELNQEYIGLQRERLAPVDTDAAEPIKAPSADFGPLFGQRG